MKKLTCIICPNGCTLTVSEGQGGYQVNGNRCKRGEQFAITEMTHPMRTVTTTVRTAFQEAPVLPVKVSGEIPKERIMDVMEALRQVVVTQPIGRGSVVLADVLGLSVDVIATSNLLLQPENKEKEKRYE